MLQTEERPESFKHSARLCIGDSREILNSASDGLKLKLSVWSPNIEGGLRQSGLPAIL